jgi:hypothetical protein
VVSGQLSVAIESIACYQTDATFLSELPICCLLEGIRAFAAILREARVLHHEHGIQPALRVDIPEVLYGDNESSHLVGLKLAASA